VAAAAAAVLQGMVTEVAADTTTAAVPTIATGAKLRKSLKRVCLGGFAAQAHSF
jgi:hypothetical protein